MSGLRTTLYEFTSKPVNTARRARLKSCLSGCKKRLKPRVLRVKGPRVVVCNAREFTHIGTPAISQSGIYVTAPSVVVRLLYMPFLCRVMPFLPIDICILATCHLFLLFINVIDGAIPCRYRPASGPFCDRSASELQEMTHF